MTVIADRYELLELLGHGGMASVHAARDRVLDRRVAVKLLRDDIGRDPVLRERFLREARLSAGLAHANIVRVYDAGVDDDTPWMAMELVEGPPLREEMDEGPLPADRAVDLVTQVLAGLGAAHAAGVVHRDVKPGNVLLAPDGAKLGDFGIAKSLVDVGADLTQVNQFMGTPKYIAPEVAIGEPASVRSDLYSAAVLLWELLAGRPPFDHDNPLTLAMMHRTDPVPPLGEVRPDLPATLVAAVESGLAKDPAQRPRDAAAFADLLRAGLRGDRAAVSAAVAPTQVLPRPAAPPPPAREQTIAMPRPAAPVGPPPARRAQPAGRGAGLGLGLLVIALLVVAAVAFLVSGDLSGEEGPVPTAGATPPTATRPPTSTPPPPATPPATTAPPVAPPPTDPQPTEPPAPTTAPPPAPATPAPTTAPPPPEPSPEPTSVLDPILRPTG